MYNGKHTGRYSGNQAGRYRRRRGKNTALILALILLLGMAVSGTIAFLIVRSDPVENTFTPANVTIEIDETVIGHTKEKVVIENKSNIPVYIRVALVGNWADAQNRICINHDNEKPKFDLGDGWKLEADGFYYYTQSVAVGGSTTDLLGSDIELTEEDGCSYQLEVIASAIQAQGMGATSAQNAWSIASGD